MILWKILPTFAENWRNLGKIWRQRRSLNCLNTEWSIKYVDKIGTTDEESWQVGNADAVTHTIKIANTVQNTNLTEKDKRLTLLHELVHAIFQTGNYNSCSCDEPLVEWVANCLLSLKEQKII